MANIWQNPSTSIPQDKAGTGDIVRVPLDQVDLGARKSHVKMADKGKNSNSIQHVKGK